MSIHNKLRRARRGTYRGAGPDRPAKAAVLVQEPLTPTLAADVAAGRLEPGLRRFRLGECEILVGRSPRHGWHLSIAHPKRLPAWGEVVEARERLLPAAATFAMLLPPREEYVNLHPRCFHLHEVAGGHAYNMAHFAGRPGAVP